MELQYKHTEEGLKGAVNELQLLSTGSLKLEVLFNNRYIDCTETAIRANKLAYHIDSILSNRTIKVNKYWKAKYKPVREEYDNIIQYQHRDEHTAKTIKEKVERWNNAPYNGKYQFNADEAVRRFLKEGWLHQSAILYHNSK